jgi:hypothetical protein
MFQGKGRAPYSTTLEGLAPNIKLTLFNFVVRDALVYFSKTAFIDEGKKVF